MVLADSFSAASVLKKCVATNPPITEPTKNKRFQRCSFHSKSKNVVFLPAPQAAQMVLKLEEKPKVRPKNNKINMIQAIKKPEKYQGQGANKNSEIVIGYIIL